MHPVITPPDPPTLEAVLEALRSPDREARLWGVDMVSQLIYDHPRIDRTLEAILAMSRAPDRLIQMSAAHALGVFRGNAGAGRGLVAMLEEAGEDRGLRLVIIKAMGAKKDPLTLPALRPLLRDSTHCIRVAATRAVEAIEAESY